MDPSTELANRIGRAITDPALIADLPVPSREEVRAAFNTIATVTLRRMRDAGRTHNAQELAAGMVAGVLAAVTVFQERAHKQVPS